LYKLQTILFIALLALAFYAKQISYLGCKYFAKTEVDCGCDVLVKKQKRNTTTDFNHNSPSHKHIAADDYVATNTTKTIPFNNAFLKKQKFVFFATNLINGSIYKIFKPPIYT
jgi:hypothetical protein